MIHPITVTGLSPRVRVVCSVCGTLAAGTTDNGADIAIMQHDQRWSR